MSALLEEIFCHGGLFRRLGSYSDFLIDSPIARVDKVYFSECGKGGARIGKRFNRLVIFLKVYANQGI